MGWSSPRRSRDRCGAGGRALLLAALALVPARAWAQGSALVTIGSPAEDRLRLAQLWGADSTGGFLLRTASTMTAPGCVARCGLSVQWLRPELRSVWNSALPFSLNDGAMWAGRGASFVVAAGLRAAYGPVNVVLAPEFTYSENLPFQIFPGRQPGLSAYSSPWHLAPNSMDLPLRFGDQSVRLADLGQSSITVYAGAVAFGGSTENQWWGPGIRNALVMSDNAEGVPHLFLRTTRPVLTPLGAVQARWILGGLTESLYFDTTASSGLRSLSGLVLTLRPGNSRVATIGLARVVYGDVKGRGQILGRALDVFASFQQPADSAQAGSTGRRDQILSLFGRWIFPTSGFEVYAEWARTELPRTLREFLLAPQNTQGYTLGFEWAPRPSNPAYPAFRLQAELSDLEQSIAFSDRPPPPDFYAGSATLEGYTQRGKVIGAAIGPGGSSEWLAGDVFGPTWQAGVFAGRIRWEDNAMLRQYAPNFFRHDFTIYGGVRGGVRLADWDVSAEVSAGRRFNYLFQNGMFVPGGLGTVDLTNYTFKLALSPR